jgi:cytosine deaminase
MRNSWNIRNAAIPGQDGRWCISVTEGCIEQVMEEGSCAPGGAGLRTWDAGGRLVSASFVDPHVHIDKALTSHRVTEGANVDGLNGAIRAVRRLKAEFTVNDVADRAQKSLGMGLVHGTTMVRTNCEVDRFVEQRAHQGIKAATIAMAGKVDVQTIAFPQEGWFETAGSIEDGAGTYVEQALQDGIRIVGGNINRAIWPSDPERQVDETFALAKLYNCDIDYHLDNWDTEQAFTLPYVAQKTIDEGWQGRVAVSHIASLACVSNALAANTIDSMKHADLQVCVLPTRMRLTRVLELMEAGVNVACGTDNMRDPFVRFGDADPLKAMLLLAQLTKQLHNAGLEKIWKTMTENSARMLRLSNHGLSAGCVADLIVVDAPSVPLAILQQPARLAVFKSGHQIAGALSIFH